MQINTKSYEAFISNDHMGEILFFTGFIIYLARGVWATTTFPLPPLISKLCLLTAILFIGLKIVLYDNYTLKLLLGAGTAIVCSIGTLYSAGYLNVTLWLFIIMGSKNIPFKKILNVYLLISGAVILLAFVSSLLGVIVNYKYITDDRGVRQSFGIVYTTDFASHIFFLIITAYYLNAERLKFYHHILTTAAACFIYYFCNARLDSISIILTALLFMIGNAMNHPRFLSRNCRLSWKNSWQAIAPFLMLICAVLSFITTIIYTKENFILNTINELLSSRLSLGQNGIKTHGIHLFGKAIEMIGAGGQSAFPEGYNFIDCSYLYITLRFGLISLLIVLIVYIWSCLKNKHDLYFLYAIALISINCVVAHHLLELEYNPFALALLSHCVRKADKTIKDSIV